MLASPDGELRVVASSSEAMRVLELFEIQARQGPCLECYRTGTAVVNQNLVVGDDRWPRFSAEALAAGFHAVHALPMRLRGTVIGALNLFHVEPGEMRTADVDAAQAFADVATIAILQHRAASEAHVLNEQLNGALNTPHRHRAGEGHRRRASKPRHGARLRHLAEPRPEPQLAARRRRHRRHRGVACATGPRPSSPMKLYEMSTSTGIGAASAAKPARRPVCTARSMVTAMPAAVIDQATGCLSAT